MSPPSAQSTDLDASFILVDPLSSQVLERPRVAEPLTSTPAVGTTDSSLPASAPPVPLPAPATPAEHASLDDAYIPGTRTTYAHDWSDHGVGGKVTLDGHQFVDVYGRACHLRGVNLSGNSKTPVNHDPTTFLDEHRTVTFVNRPFSLEEAPEHFSRLRRWGLTFIRFLVTWEAVEHEGPGIYDRDYLTYIRELLSLLPQYGLLAFVSVHQDVWSRYSGGSGAPAWTLEAVGFDLHALEETAAAWLQGVRGDANAERGIWPCGYQKMAAATMATCFWAGDMFTPKLHCDNGNSETKPVQQFLQDAFLNMWTEIARAVGDLPAILGFQMMNEPHRGYVEQHSLHEFVYETDLHLSFVPSAYESFLLGAGHPTPVRHWTRSFPFPTRHTSTQVLNKGRKKVWRQDGPTGGRCLWEMHGVWGWDQTKDTGVVLRESYFQKNPQGSQQVNWYQEFYYPFAKRWSERVREVGGQDKLVFLEPIPNEFCPTSWTPDKRPANMVYAPHWYDLKALFEKAFGDFSVNVQGLSRGMFLLKAFYWGQQGVRDNYALQIGTLVEKARIALGPMPVIIGECGIPIDLNGGEAFKFRNWKWQARMMDAMLVALERAGVGFTLWNYNPDNSDIHGDYWNGENFSWFSSSRARAPSLTATAQSDASLDEGARVLTSVVRPYAAKVAGVLKRCDYEVTTGKCVIVWAERSGVRARETEVFVPDLVLRGRKLRVSFPGAGEDAYKWKHDSEQQTLFVLPRGKAEEGKEHTVVLELDPPLKGPFVVNSFWSDFAGWLMGALVALLSVVWVLLRA